MFFKSLKFVVLLWIGIFVGWIISTANEWYFYYWWVDVILHFAGGFWLFILARYATEHYQIEITGPQKKLIKFFVFISFVVFVGTLWELYEFVSDRYIFLNGYTFLSGAYEDTLADLFTDALGGITAFVLYFKNGKT